MIRLVPGSYYGEAERVRSVDGVTFSETSYPPGLGIPRHEHTHPFFCLVLSGLSTEVIGTRTPTNRPSTLVYHPAGEAHSNQWHESGGRLFHIEIAPARLERVREHAPVLAGPADFQGGLPAWLARRAYHEFLRADDCSPLAMEGLVLEMLAEASRRRTAPLDRRLPRWLCRVRDLLDARFAEVITLGELAAEVGVDPDHLARAFRTHLGCTPGEYVRRLRVEFACRCMSSSDTPLVVVALEAGFSDQSHFTKTFKRFMGMTPTEFRRNRLPRRTDTRRGS